MERPLKTLLDLHHSISFISDLVKKKRVSLCILKDFFFQVMVKEVRLICKDWCDHHNKVEFGFKGKMLQQMGTILFPCDFLTVTEAASRGRQTFPAAALIFR